MLTRSGRFLFWFNFFAHFFQPVHSPVATLLQVPQPKWASASASKASDTDLFFTLPKNTLFTDFFSGKTPHNFEEQKLSSSFKPKLEVDRKSFGMGPIKENIQDTLSQERAFPRKAILNEWEKELEIGLEAITEYIDEVGDFIKATHIFEVVPWLFATTISNEAMILRLPENDWSLMENFPDKLLEGAKEFETLKSEFSISGFPSLFKARSALDYVKFGLEIEKMNNRLNKKLLDKMEKASEIVPELLRNSEKVNKIIDESEKNFYETTKFLPVDYIEQLISFSKKNSHSRAWISEMKAYKSLKKEIGNRNDIYEQLETTASLAIFTKEIKRVRMFEILRRISTLSISKELMFKYVARVNATTKFKQILNLPTSVRKLPAGPKDFDFLSLHKVQTISDLEKYESRAILFQTKIQRKLLTTMLEAIDSNDLLLLIQSIRSVLNLSPEVAQFKAERPELSLDLSDHLQPLKRDFDKIWPLKPFFEKSQSDESQDNKKALRSLRSTKSFFSKKHFPPTFKMDIYFARGFKSVYNKSFVKALGHKPAVD